MKNFKKEYQDFCQKTGDTLNIEIGHYRGKHYLYCVCPVCGHESQTGEFDFYELPGIHFSCDQCGEVLQEGSQED
jgi:predicted RNA-binding Zn-ribbon protein involved in translation (DUF1610 family)